MESSKRTRVVLLGREKKAIKQISLFWMILVVQFVTCFQFVVCIRSNE
ncbi:unnamed protein product [Tenebrio molitor]|nr:unnamed protein product [Tenebrio molitor]